MIGQAATLAQLQAYRKYKLKFASQFMSDKATIQLCVDEFIKISIDHNGKLNAENIVDYITANPTCILNNIFYTLKPKTEEEKIAIIEDLISQITILIGSDNFVYLIEVNNG